MEIFMYKCQNALVPDSVTNSLGQCILIKNQLQNQEMYIKGAKIWNEIPCEIPEQSIASKETEETLHENAMQCTIKISYISAYTDASSVAMIQLIFLLLFIVSSYFNIY